MSHTTTNHGGVMLRFRVYEIGRLFAWTVFRRCKERVDYLDYGKEMNRRAAEDAAVSFIRGME